MYKEIAIYDYDSNMVKLNTFTVQKDTILRVTDGVFIPFAPANTDYQEYLKWLAEGNTPEPADE
jgi:hypothetical protein